MYLQLVLKWSVKTLFGLQIKSYIISWEGVGILL